MKLNETIELNGKEYTVELNRESILRIEQYVNTQKANQVMTRQPYEDKSTEDIKDNEDPFATAIEEDEIIKVNKEKEDFLRKMFTRAFWIWLYPTEKLSIKEVEEILEPYFIDEDKAAYMAKKYEEFTEKSVDVRIKFLENQKNLKALAK